jgi:peptide-methionine (R)-S-oxide reductase
MSEKTEKIQKTEDQWREELTPEAFAVLRNAATERPFTGELLHNKDNGMYQCAGCGADLFSSDTKFDSGSGWPSFYDVASSENVRTHEDRSMGMVRTEVTCARCGGHLGHVFPDGPNPTGLRYCINSCALNFDKK